MKTDTLELAPARGDRPALTFQVGDHPALDFLNTTATVSGRRVDWLETGDDLLKWLMAMQSIDDTTAARFSRPACREKLDATVVEVVTLREWFRDLLMDVKAQPEARLSAKQRLRLNRELSRAPDILRIDETGGRLVLKSEKILGAPGDLTGVVAGWIAELLCEGNLALIRLCESQDCTLWYYDRTKSHRRRWCSAAMCGNREKVAAHRARKGRGKAS
ncbi:MAG: ABATE domain-containing protein [Roseovarius sp.]|nr:ABATE domain-containing protein [Roseovarius sp.]